MNVPTVDVRILREKKGTRNNSNAPITGKLEYLWPWYSLLYNAAYIDFSYVTLTSGRSAAPATPLQWHVGDWVDAAGSRSPMAVIDVQERHVPGEGKYRTVKMLSGVASGLRDEPFREIGIYFGSHGPAFTNTAAHLRFITDEPIDVNVDTIYIEFTFSMFMSETVPDFQFTAANGTVHTVRTVPLQIPHDDVNQVQRCTGGLMFCSAENYDVRKTGGMVYHTWEPTNWDTPPEPDYSYTKTDMSGKLKQGSILATTHFGGYPLSEFKTVIFGLPSHPGLYAMTFDPPVQFGYGQWSEFEFQFEYRAPAQWQAPIVDILGLSTAKENARRRNIDSTHDRIIGAEQLDNSDGVAPHCANGQHYINVSWEVWLELIGKDYRKLYPNDVIRAQCGIVWDTDLLININGRFVFKRRDNTVVSEMPYNAAVSQGGIMEVDFEWPVGAVKVQMFIQLEEGNRSEKFSDPTFVIYKA